MTMPLKQTLLTSVMFSFELLNDSTRAIVSRALMQSYDPRKISWTMTRWMSFSCAVRSRVIFLKLRDKLLLQLCCYEHATETNNYRGLSAGSEPFEDSVPQTLLFPPKILLWPENFVSNIQCNINKNLASVKIILSPGHGPGYPWF